MMYLFLNTSTPERIEFFFASEKEIIFQKRVMQNKRQRIDVLSEIAEGLKSIHKTTRAIRGIGIAVGPGYFSHLRTGIAIANAWSFATNIPLIGIPTDRFSTHWEYVQEIIVKLKNQKRRRLIIPQYGKEPTITRKS